MQFKFKKIKKVLKKMCRELRRPHLRGFCLSRRVCRLRLGLLPGERNLSSRLRLLLRTRGSRLIDYRIWKRFELNLWRQKTKWCCSFYRKSNMSRIGAQLQFLKNLFYFLFLFLINFILISKHVYKESSSFIKTKVGDVFCTKHFNSLKL